MREGGRKKSCKGSKREKGRVKIRGKERVRERERRERRRNVREKKETEWVYDKYRDEERLRKEKGKE